MELAKSVIDLISSIFILGGIIWATYKAVALFNYRYDSEIRKMYIDNCKSIREIIGRVMISGVVTTNDYEEVKEVFQNSVLFLHKDVVDFTFQVYNVIATIEYNEIDLADAYDDNIRKEKAEKICNARNKLVDLNKKSLIIYRKHIVNDGINFGRFKDIINGEI